MNIEEAEQSLQHAAQDTHTAIAAVASAQAALNDARKPGRDQNYVMDVARTFRSCEAIMTEKIQAEIEAHQVLFELQIQEFDKEA